MSECFCISKAWNRKCTWEHCRRSPGTSAFTLTEIFMDHSKPLIRLILEKGSCCTDKQPYKISYVVCSWSVWVQQWVSEVAGVSCWRRALCPGTCWSLHRAVWSMLQQAAPNLCFLPPPQSGQTLWRTLFKGLHKLLFIYRKALKSELLCNLLVKVTDFWTNLSIFRRHRKGLRVIAESEIGLAAIYASCDQYCNPSRLITDSGGWTHREAQIVFFFHIIFLCVNIFVSTFCSRF